VVFRCVYPIKLTGFFVVAACRDVVSVSRRTNVSSRSHLGQNPQRLGVGPTHLGSRLGLDAIRLVSGLGPFRHVETFCAGASRVLCIAAVRPMKPV